MGAPCPSTYNWWHFEDINNLKRPFFFQDVMGWSSSTLSPLNPSYPLIFNWPPFQPFNSGHMKLTIPRKVTSAAELPDGFPQKFNPTRWGPKSSYKWSYFTAIRIGWFHIICPFIGLGFIHMFECSPQKNWGEDELQPILTTSHFCFKRGWNVQRNQHHLDKGHLGGGFKYFLFPSRSNLTNILQMGWNHQPVIYRGPTSHPFSGSALGSHAPSPQELVQTFLQCYGFRDVHSTKLVPRAHGEVSRGRGKGLWFSP